nr:hypothetical protein [uncultured Undibacterium sp.]
MMLSLIPKLFYADIQVGLDLFIRGLGFELLHQDSSISVLGRDQVKVYLMEDAKLAALDRPEIAIEIDNIDEIHAEIVARAPELLHPNLPAVQLRPWGAKEFAMIDASKVCVVFRQW